jgi:hypothetical protein
MEGDEKYVNDCGPAPRNRKRPKGENEICVMNGRLCRHLEDLVKQANRSPFKQELGSEESFSLHLFQSRTSNTDL